MVTILILSPVFGQDEGFYGDDDVKTLFGNGYVSHGGYGSFSVGYSEIDAKDALTMGARGAWVIGHWFALGFAGNGFLNDYHYDRGLSRNVNLSGGYGGLLMEPIMLPRFPVHISFPVVIGVGGIAYTTSYTYSEWSDPEYFVEDATSFLVLEPGVELEFNVVRFFRIAIGGYYRYTSDISLINTPPDVLNGYSGGITLKFGKF